MEGEFQLFLTELKEETAYFIENSKLNFIEDFGGIQIFDTPIIGVASASDLMWKNLKEPEVVGPNHLTPNDWLPDAGSVISYFLPFTETIRQSNQARGIPSKEWVYGR